MSPHSSNQLYIMPLETFVMNMNIKTGDKKNM